jgi:hypothetical protein
VRVSELEHARKPSSSTTHSNAVFDINVCGSDGVTVIGIFRVLDDTPGPRDGDNK